MELTSSLSYSKRTIYLYSTRLQLRLALAKPYNPMILSRGTPINLVLTLFMKTRDQVPLFAIIAWDYRW